MAGNDTEGWRGEDVVDGLANQTTSSVPSNFLRENNVDQRYDAHAASGERDLDKGDGVVEAGVDKVGTGLLDNTKIEPLAESGSGGKPDDFSAAGTGVGSSQTAQGLLDQARAAYDSLTGSK